MSEASEGSATKGPQGTPEGT